MANQWGGPFSAVWLAARTENAGYCAPPANIEQLAGNKLESTANNEIA